ncbi:SprT family protein [Falsibacillus albus]|uniref:SprT family protein n=1 Tax=Falsibacillus albus TaxID=2478915 RepID=UPI001F2146EB|nr:SprT family protein [Falsibacillus albus]
MNDEQLQRLTEELSKDCFRKSFRHQAVFNKRLKTTGGRYMLQSHNIEINRTYYEAYGMDELVGIIKHELCHYHLHLEGKGYRHRDFDFKTLMKEVDAPRHCTPLKQTNKNRPVFYHIYQCKECRLQYRRKRRVNTKKYVCGKCNGKLKKID